MGGGQGTHHHLRDYVDRQRDSCPPASCEPTGTFLTPPGCSGTAEPPMPPPVPPTLAGATVSPVLGHECSPTPLGREGSPAEPPASVDLVGAAVPQHGGQASPENRCPGRCLRLGVEDGPCAAGRHHAGRAAGLTMASADPHATARSHRGLVSVTSPSGWRLCFSLCAQILFWRGNSKPVPRWGANAHLVSGAWAAQSVEHLPLDFGSGYDLTVVGLSPRLGSALTAQSV